MCLLSSSIALTDRIRIALKMRKPCCDKEGNNKGAWSKQEDQKLIDYITSHGEGCWRSLPMAAGLHRCGKSCRLRWINYLRPDIKRGNFGPDEEDLIIKLHALLGNRWSLIAGRLPGRTDNEVKNYWNSHLRKRLLNMGINPNNHRINPNQPHFNLIQHKVDKSKEQNNRKCNNSKDRVSKSDEASCLEDEINCSSSNNLNLNLDLSISVPSTTTPSAKIITNFETTRQICDAPIETHDHISPALILFL